MNPLRLLDTYMQFYLMSLLAWMWSMVFSLAYLSIFVFHWVWLGHLLVLMAIFITKIAIDAARNRAPALDRSMEKRCVWDLNQEA